MSVGITAKRQSVSRSISIVPKKAESDVQVEDPTLQHVVAIHPRTLPKPTRSRISIEQTEGGKTHNCVLHRDGYSIRVANSSAQRRKARMLVERMYCSRGYGTAVALLPHNPRRITFEASNGLQTFGTLTLGLDGQDGLLADALYDEEINAYREKARKLCELSSFAIDPEHSSREMPASLFQLAYIYARMIYRSTDVVIEVNPRHAGYYKRMLGFSQIGETRICPRVDAPAVLLHLELSYMDAQIRRHSGALNPGERSLYPYFLSICESSSSADRCLNCAMRSRSWERLPVVPEQLGADASCMPIRRAAVKG